MIIQERQALKPDTILTLGDKQCCIIEVLGFGASSIVYKAYMKLKIRNKIRCRNIVLKELYPAQQNIIRENNNSLVILEMSKEKFEDDCESFIRSSKLQFDFHNKENTTNYTSDIEMVYELNNTLYSIMGIMTGNSYDKIKPENITAILKVGKSLTQAISHYHKKGYLHLDIKPANIYKLPETDELVQLFDFNTVCTKEEILQNKFSYSYGYVAPEVKAGKNGNGKLSDIDERADIFSIGVIIFQKIMGRLPDTSDHREGKKWNLNSNFYLKNTVPQLQKGVTELFRKTIARDKDQRYKSAEELITNLTKLIKLTSIDVYLKNQKISPCTPKDIYITRKIVLSDIKRRLNQYNILYLYAIRGSGKSETAKEYAEAYANQYDFIQSIFYNQTLKKTIADLDFIGLSEEDRIAQTDEEIDRLYSYKLGLIGNTTIYGTNTLLIIDNYDYDSNPESDEYQQNIKVISDLKKLHIHIIFTTRINSHDKTCYLKLDDMSPDELRMLFFKINPIDKDDPKRIKLVDEIIKNSYNHTMTVKLIALQSKKYKKPLSEYLNILKKNGINLHIKGRITNQKDDEETTMMAVYDHILALFNFDNLSNKEKYVMVNACLLPLSGFNQITFSNFIDLDNYDSISENDCLDESIENLINSGWMMYTDSNETKIALHPLICDIVSNELKPELSENKCRKFYIAFLDLISDWGNGKVNLTKDYVIKENMIYTLFPKLYNIFTYKKIKNTINYILIHNKKFHIKNYSIISFEDVLIKYFGIEQKYEIQNNIKSIGKGVFLNYSSLTQITIPDNVTTIGEGTFSGCSSLTQITIPDSVTTIGNNAFYNCSSLTHIIIPDNIEYISFKLFLNCKKLRKIKILNSNIEIYEGGLGYYEENGLYMKNKNLEIQGYKNSTAEEYAQNNGFKFTFINEN